MANNKMKHEKNVEGSWYCTHPDDADGCTACSICYISYPEFFNEDDDGFAFVVRQPESTTEITTCQEAKDSCPSDSIGDDG